MSPELQRAYDALQQADEAGNVEDAQQIADYIRELEAQGNQTDMTFPVGGLAVGTLTGAATGPTVGAAVDVAATKAAEKVTGPKGTPRGDKVAKWLATQTTGPNVGGATFKEAFKKSETARGVPVQSRGSKVPIRKGFLGIENQPAEPSLPQKAAANVIAGEKLGKPGVPRRVAGMGVMGAEAGKTVSDIEQGNIGDAILSAIGTAGGAMSQSRIKPIRALGTGISLLVPSVQGYQAVKDIYNPPKEEEPEKKATGGLVYLAKGKRVIQGAQTVTDAVRNAFPGIYKRPDVIAQEAAERVAPESPALKQLFGVTRDDLFQMGKGRVGNMSGVLPGAAANPKGSKAAIGVMNPQNEQRLLDVLQESEKYPELVKGMDPWYIMDPVYKRMEQIMGPEKAKASYQRFNTLTGMASPGSDVLTEMNRGTAANYLAEQNRFGDFLKYAGKPASARGADFPEDLRSVMGHPYHMTAQGIPMKKYLESGEIQMKSPKVPAYIQASSVPEVGFQTNLPVGDAHWSRAVGLADTRGGQSFGASVSNPEMTQLAPWWKEKIAGQVGLESVPAQARAWGAFSPQTGVESPIGAPKIELLAMKIMETAKRLNISPEEARDMVLTGKAYAGKKEGGIVNGYADGGLSMVPQPSSVTAQLAQQTPPNLGLPPVHNLDMLSSPDSTANRPFSGLNDPNMRYAPPFKEGGSTTPAWQRAEGKNPEGGLNAKGRASYNRETGGDLKAPQPEGGSRKKSFCARMGGMKKKLTSSKTANDPDSRINKALRKWKC